MPQFALDGFIKVIFVKTEDNDLDLFTKNLEGVKHKKHLDKLIVNMAKFKLNFSDCTTGRVLR